MSTLPTHTIYAVTKSDRTNRDSKGYWQPIGAAWQHQDGDGLTLKLEMLPLNLTTNTQIVIRRRKTDKTGTPTNDDAPTYGDPNRQPGDSDIPF